MRYTCDVVIDLPRERVVELFDDPDNLVQWQPGLESVEHLSGEPGQPGARSRLVYQHGSRRIEMTETVTRRELPEAFEGTYETDGVWNRVANRFVDERPGTTRWICDSDFRFSGFMRLMAFFMRGAFRKQTLTILHSFKDFAEGTREAG